MSASKRPGFERCGDRGQVLLLLITLVLVTTVVSLLVLARLGPMLADRAQARTAADAGALASVTGGDDEARRVVEANGGTVVELSRKGERVEIRVRVGGAEATSVAVPSR